MRRAALSGVGLLSVVMTVCLLLGGDFAEALFGVVASVFPVVLIAVGGARGARPNRAFIGLLFALVCVITGSVVWMLFLRGSVETGGDWPLAAAVLLLGLWLMPLLIVGFGYAALFDRHFLSQEDLRRLRSGTGADHGRGSLEP